jgi:Ni,Fe-hydrogenase III large subunit
MGPYHPGLEEPYKLEMICEGETVRDAKLKIGFNLRGIEHLAETRNYIQVTALMERVCGICSNIHTLTLCQAMEKLTGQTPPPRALYIRVVMAELERLHSHVLWAGIAAKLMGFKTMFMTCFELREKVMDVLAAISGNRVNYSMNRIGGVNRNIEAPLALLSLIDYKHHRAKALRGHRRADARESHLLRRGGTHGTRLGPGSGSAPLSALRGL